MLVFAGLRVGEACALCWRDVDLTTGRITVRESSPGAGVAKTGAGTNRRVDMLPILRDELARYAERDKPADAGSDSFVFTTARGTPRDKDNVAARVIKPVIERADELLVDRDEVPLPARLTAHKLRHTFASLLAACGEDFRYVVDQMGHANERVTLRVYTHMMSRREGERERLKALVAGEDWRRLGTGLGTGLGTKDASEGSSAESEPAPEQEKTPPERGIPEVGATGLEPVTSSLSSWRSPN